MTIDIANIDQARMPDRTTQSRPATADFSHELARHASQQEAARGNQAKANAAGAAGKQGADVSAAAARQPAAPEQNGKAAASLFGNDLHDLSVQPTGITEALIASRVFGVHLLAGRYLSELTPATDQPAAGQAADATSAVAMTDGEAPAMPAAASLAVPGAAENVAPAAVGSLPARVPPAAADSAGSEAARGTGETEKLLAGSPTISWVERSLRFVKQADGRVTVWLRDYRLGGAETAAVIESALHAARAQGMTVGKIMLNGSEAWSSRSDSQENRS